MSESAYHPSFADKLKASQGTYGEPVSKENKKGLKMYLSGTLA